MQFESLLEELKSSHILQKSLEWEECIPEKIWKKNFEISSAEGKEFPNYRVVSDLLNVSKHRHYETSVTVVEIYGKFLGILHISDIFSEQSSCEDCFHYLEFFEMKEVTTVTYVKA